MDQSTPKKENCNNDFSRKKYFINSDILNSDALEAHFVHFKSEYNDATTALTKSDGVAVLGVLFVVSIYKIVLNVYQFNKITYRKNSNVAS
jgi:hypothetical protein